MTREKAIEVLWRTDRLGVFDETHEAIELAIQALEIETCENAISRQTAIEAIWDGTNMDIYTSEVKEILEGLPPVQPKTKTEWIPTKWHKVTDEEREREGYSKEITFMLDGSMPSDEQEVLICLKNGYVEKDTCYYGEDGYFTDNGYDWIEDIVAWMPLPEPYKAESEDKE